LNEGRTTLQASKYATTIIKKNMNNNKKKTVLRPVCLIKPHSSRHCGAKGSH